MHLYGLGRPVGIALAALVVSAAAASSDHDERRRSSSSSVSCSALTFADALPTNAKIERAVAVAAGSTYGDGLADLAYPTQPTGLPALCAVTVVVASSTTSTYRLGLFLPDDNGDDDSSSSSSSSQGGWNGRFLAVGNGGFGGGINWMDMGAGAHYGFAVVSTDTGHDSATASLSWALGDDEAKADWGWRAMHGSVTLGKALTAAYYGRAAARSYYSGCSTGGRQGLREAQSYPDSFDGVVVGAAAWYTSHLNPWVVQAARYNWPATDPKHIDWRLLPAVADEVVRQCDGADGVADGIISLPGQCEVDFGGALSCDQPGANKSACLTDAQAQTLRNVYGDWNASWAAGELLYKGLSPGSERQMYAVLNYSDASPYGIGYARYFVLDNASFALADFDDSLVALADARDPGNATAAVYDLAPFRDRGGRLLMYHGAADGLVPTQGSNLYYDRVVEAMGGNATAVGEFFRYFMVPGMQHCWSTAVDAPWAFGAPSQASVLGDDVWSVPGFRDAQHDILLALVDWVEKNATVDRVVATTWTQPTNASSGVLRQRPLCPYPQMANWDGDGDVDDAESWSCGGDVNISPVSTGEAHYLSWKSSVTLLTVSAVILTWWVN
ncbi:putative feruloyl esterase B [Rosellinia necatrix]|uniref:Carboxylic ester hydrolase n=1 Tax=Rosellinia necatrix TaxID=77044 RepID=A0A1W2TT08_ROSNE|nr:putative feruloyl esterase B [Rosellinia necatrix]